MSISFSIGLVYYNGLEYLLPCLSSLLSQDGNEKYEILIRDQSHRKEAAFFITKHFEKELKNGKIRLWSGENLFHSGGHNALFSEKKYQYYVCASIDMHYSRNMLLLFAHCIDTFPNHSVFGGKILQQKALLIDSVGIRKTWYGRFLEEGYGENPTKYSTPRTVFGISGALFCIDGTLLEKNEPLFEPSLHYKNDCELMFRVEKKGKKVLSFPEILGYHHRTVSADATKNIFALKSSLQGQKFIMKYLAWYTKIPATLLLAMQYCRLWIAVVKNFRAAKKKVA